MNSPVAFPTPSSPLVGKDGRINQAWLQLLITLWNRTGGGIGADSSGAAQTVFWAGSAVGSGDSIVLTVASNSPTSYSDGQRFMFQASYDNHGPVVAVVTGLNALPALKADSRPLDEEDILAGRLYEFIVAGNKGRFQVSEFMPQSPSEILRQLLTVDGAGSGLDAAFLDGLTSAEILGGGILANQVFGA